MKSKRKYFGLFEKSDIQTDQSKQFITLKQISENHPEAEFRFPPLCLKHRLVTTFTRKYPPVQDHKPAPMTYNIDLSHTDTITPFTLKSKGGVPWGTVEQTSGLKYDNFGLHSHAHAEPRVSVADHHRPLCNNPGGQTPRQDACKPRAGLFLGNTCQVQQFCALDKMKRMLD